MSRFERTVLVKRKPVGGFGRWPVYELGSDEFGRWFFAPQGTVYWGHGADGGVLEWDVGHPGDLAEGVASLHLIPREGWWVGHWCEFPDRRLMSVDVAEPAGLVDGEWSYLDLKLDPVWDSLGRLEIEDEDEFLEAIGAGGIDSGAASAARLAADQTFGWLRDQVEPFGEVGWGWRSRGLAAGLPALWVDAR